MFAVSKCSSHRMAERFNYERNWFINKLTNLFYYFDLFVKDLLYLIIKSILNFNLYIYSILINKFLNSQILKHAFKKEIKISLCLVSLYLIWNPLICKKKYSLDSSHESSCIRNLTINFSIRKIKTWMFFLKSFKQKFLFKTFLFNRI